MIIILSMIMAITMVKAMILMLKIMNIMLYYNIHKDNHDSNVIVAGAANDDDDN